MAFIGSILKGAVNLNQKLDFSLRSPKDHQIEELKTLLKTAKDTSFGKYYNFDSILESPDLAKSYKERVPIHSYSEINERWWSQQRKNPDITWPGQPDFYALSSGTTGKSSKRIPITKEYLESTRRVGASLLKYLPNYNFPESLFEKEVLMLSSSADLHSNSEGHLEGEISGINVSNFPDWYDIFYRPGKEIASIDDWDTRLARIVDEAPSWDIGAIAGIPSWVLLMLQEIIKKHKLKNIHEIWPDLAVFASGGVAFETYRQGFDAVCEKPLAIIDTYLASEGFFAYSTRPDSLSMRMSLNHGYYYEFIPFDERGVDDQGALLQYPESHGLDEVKLNKEYVLVISSCSGAWRYAIGDVIKFTSLDPFEIKLTGRTKFFLNVVGSQLSEEKMDAAILETSDILGVNVSEYSVAAMSQGNNEYIHQWIIVSEDHISSSSFSEKLDDSLKEANKNYEVARGKALKGIKVKVIKKDQYHAYLDLEKKKGGQVKTPKVMKEKRMAKYLDFIQKL